jgi:hypothetical protein
MSLYALIHLRNSEIAAVFVYPTADLAVSEGVEYAKRSGFFHVGDQDAKHSAERRLRRDHRLTSDCHDGDRLVVKRAEAVEGSMVRI